MSEPSAPIPATELERIPRLVERLQRGFASGRTRPLAWRTEQLTRLAALARENRDALIGALQRDFGKPAIEALLTDVAIVAAEADLARKALARWTKPERVATPASQQPGRARLVREPVGTVLIIAPWNYPVQLLLSPLVGALAAGNCAVLKPSELTPHTSAVLADLVPRYLDPECVALVEGGVAETTRAPRRALRPRLLHRRRRRRPGGDGGGREAPDAGDPRARRQEPLHRRRDREPRRRRAPDRVGQVPERRPDLHRAGLRAGGRAPRGRAAGEAGRRRARVLRRRAEAEPGLRAHREPAPLRAARALPEGRGGGLRRRARARGALHRADGAAAGASRRRRDGRGDLRSHPAGAGRCGISTRPSPS